MQDNINFLVTRSNASLRKEINNIVNSYNSSWDILCEVFQNSFDAIVRYNRLYGEKNIELYSRLMLKKEAFLLEILELV